MNEPLIQLPKADTYLSIKEKSQGLYKEKGSRFISFAYPVENIQEVKSILNASKKEFFDARHRTYAYVLGYDRETFRANDDGEPSGTAGRPIYGQLQSLNLTQVLLIVVRYFGGIKLGTSGLIKAYKTAAEDALNSAEIVEKNVLCKINVFCGYDRLSLVMRVLKEVQASSMQTIMDENCCIKVEVSKATLQTVMDLNKEIGIRVELVSLLVI